MDEYLKQGAEKNKTNYHSQIFLLVGFLAEETLMNLTFDFVFGGSFGGNGVLLAEFGFGL